MKYLEVYLPSSIMLILAIYTLKEISFLIYPYGIPEITGILSVIILHILYRNTLLSIVLGTFSYVVVYYYFISLT